MSTKHAIERHDALLDRRLRETTNGHLCMETYRAVRMALRVAGILIAAAAMFYQPVAADPIPALMIIAAFVLGPDVVEAYLTRE